MAADGGIDVGTWINAGVSLLVAFALATLLDRAFRGRAAKAAAARTGLSREGATRLRFVRRLLYATIVLIGIAVALSGFTGISKLATSLLASGAIAAAIIGFAARQTLANFIAGIMLAITQPIRVGDWVTFEGNYGVVEDVSLNHTILRTATEQRIVIPNERLAGGILRNDTLVVDLVALDVAVWLPPEADVERAIAALHDETGQDVSVAEAVPWGTRLAVGSDPVSPPEKAPAEAALRRQCLKRLRREGLLAGGLSDRA
jgi:small-conductance mechanosensitive channel